MAGSVAGCEDSGVDSTAGIEGVIFGAGGGEAGGVHP